MSKIKYDTFEMDGITIYTTWQVPNLNRTRSTDANPAAAYGRRWNDKQSGRRQSRANPGRRWTDR